MQINPNPAVSVPGKGGMGHSNPTAGLYRGVNQALPTNPSPETQRYISGKISKLHHEGYTGKQAIAIAYSYARRTGHNV